MKIAVFGKHFKHEFDTSVRDFLCRLKDRDHSLVIFSDFLGFLRERNALPEEVFDVFSSHLDLTDCELFISIGGDGTLLDSVAFVRESQIPILGINTGRLGFLSNISSDEIETAIEAIESRRYYLDRRTLIKVDCPVLEDDDFPFALNEVTISKYTNDSMVTVHAYMGDRYINTYWADGLIVATPTGSTAYSLSCGGPIVMPGAAAFVLTPIAPHNLNVRPLVVPNNALLRLSADGRGEKHRLTLDSRHFDLPSGVEVFLQTADFKINLLNLEHQHFFQTIRNKMMWGLDKRN